MLQVELKVVGGIQDGQLIRLKTGKFLIGREPDCQLRPKSDLVSRHHCAFTIDEYTARVRDLGSTNGTFVNDERIRGQVVLNPGDRVRVGTLDLEVVVRQSNPTRPNPQTESSGDTASFSAAASETLVDHPPNAPASVGDTTIINLPEVSPPTEEFPPGEEFIVQPQYAQPEDPSPPADTTSLPEPAPVAASQPDPGNPQPRSPASERNQKSASRAMPIKLPDPSTTGAKSPLPQPQEAKSSGEAEPEVNPSDHAAEIIRRFRHRRPGS